jgi:hypothetical protein
MTLDAEYALLTDEAARLEAATARSVRALNKDKQKIQRNLQHAASAADSSAEDARDDEDTSVTTAAAAAAQFPDATEMRRVTADHDKQMRVLQNWQQNRLLEPIRVTLIQGRTSSLAEYFMQCRAGGFPEADGAGSDARIAQGGEDDSPFYANRLGTQLQNPGVQASNQVVINKEGQLAAAQRNLAAKKQRELHMTIAQTHASEFYKAIRQAEQIRDSASQRPGLKNNSGNNNLQGSAVANMARSSNRQMQLATPKLMVSDVNDACKVSFDELPVCSNNLDCVGVTVLPPLQPTGINSPLRMWCAPDEYARFLSTGVLPQKTAHGQCLPCMMSAFTGYIFQRRQSNTAGQLDQPPFTVHVDRVGGFTRDSILSCERLGSDFPMFTASMFIPCATVIERKMLDVATGKQHTREVAVVGYEMSPNVCWAGIDGDRNTRMVNIVNPLHSAYCSLSAQSSSLSTPYELLTELLMTNPTAKVYASGGAARVYNIECWLKALCCPFADTLRYIEDTENSAAALCDAMNVLISATLTEFGATVTRQLSQERLEDVLPVERVKQASVCTALMARCGLVLLMSNTFNIDRATDKSGVCAAYYDSHQALVKFVVEKWRFAGPMPKNSDLYGIELAGRPTYNVLAVFLQQKKIYPEVKQLDVVREASDLHKVTRALVINHRTNGFSHMKHVALRFLPSGTLTDMTTGSNVCVLSEAVEKLCADDG